MVMEMIESGGTAVELDLEAAVTKATIRVIYFINRIIYVNLICFRWYLYKILKLSFSRQK